METKIYPNAVVTVDPSFGQIYICIKPELRYVRGCSKKTVEIKEGKVILDLDEKGEVIGIEIL